jgi:hypothetical protein
VSNEQEGLLRLASFLNLGSDRTLYDIPEVLVVSLRNCIHVLPFPSVGHAFGSLRAA